MRKPIFIGSLMLASILFFNGCKKKDDTPAAATNSSGTSTATCTDCNLSATLNGAEYKSKATAGINSSIFQIEAKDFKNKNNTLLIQLVFDSLKTNTYYFADIVDLSYFGDKYCYGSYANSDMKLFTTDSISKTTDKLTISKFDKANKLISGTFNFTARESSSNKVIFTNGSFTDVKW